MVDATVTAPATTGRVCFPALSTQWMYTAHAVFFFTECHQLPLSPIDLFLPALRIVNGPTETLPRPTPTCRDLESGD